MNALLKKILSQITDAGFEAYLIGGYPRDFYLGLETHDYDIATSATPDQLKTIFPHADMTDQKYGRITLQESFILWKHWSKIWNVEILLLIHYVWIKKETLLIY